MFIPFINKVLADLKPFVWLTFGNYSSFSWTTLSMAISDQVSFHRTLSLQKNKVAMQQAETRRCFSVYQTSAFGDFCNVCVWVFICIYVYLPHGGSTCRNQMRALDSPEPELQTHENHHVNTGNWLFTSSRQTQFQHQVPSLVQEL